jgi:class 3 adenylate cyclase
VERNNRTWLCSVLFLDIVGYSTLAVDRQMVVKQNFSAVASDAMRSLADQDCIKLDTGDGLAICYLGDPEDLLYVALAVRDAFRQVSKHCSVCYTVRMGINMGPVKIFEDINGQRNVIGDGINVAQRIMGFAQPNQLLVSRTYYDMVGCLSDEIHDMFAYRGVRNDKHVRKHAIYEVLQPGMQVMQETALAEVNEPLDQPAQPPVEEKALDERIVAAVQEQLALYIGPMAKILIKQALEKSPSIDELYEILVQDIPSEQEKASFLGSKKQLH